MGLNRAISVAAMLAAGCSTTHRAIHLDDPAIASRFEFMDAAIWSVDTSAGELVFTEGSTYRPPHRSPRALAILDDPVVGSYEMIVECMQTGRDYGHRDLCIFFDWQDPAHFGYLHLAMQADPRSHHVQIVDARERTPVTTFRTSGVDWGRDQWHEVRLVRSIETGLIQGWFDGELVLEATDSRFRGGRVGVGSFDDQGRFRRIVIRDLGST